MIKIKPSERADYPELFSKSQLKEKGLMPAEGITPAAMCVRQMYGNYYLYSIGECIPYVVSEETKKKKRMAAQKRKRMYTCPVCRTYLGVCSSFEMGKYPGMCDNCFYGKREEYYNLLSSPTDFLENDIIRYDFVVVDVETTGLSSKYDEIIQLSILSNTGEVLFNKSFLPYYHLEYPEASGVNGLSYDKLEGCSYIFDSVNEINNILRCAGRIVGYNVSFDLDFISALGIKIREDAAIDDVMLDFAQLYGEEDGYRGGYRWKSLSFCADYFHFKYISHDSLEDCKATLHCYMEMGKLHPPK